MVHGCIDAFTLDAFPPYRTKDKSGSVHVVSRFIAPLFPFTLFSLALVLVYIIFAVCKTRNSNVIRIEYEMKKFDFCFECSFFLSWWSDEFTRIFVGFKISIVEVRVVVDCESRKNVFRKMVPEKNGPGTNFPGTIFLWTLFPGDHFSGDHFSRGPIFRGPFFQGPFFCRPFFCGPFFLGTIFLWTIFPATIFPRTSIVAD